MTQTFHAKDCSDNYVDSLIDCILSSLAKSARSVNANVGYTPTTSVTIPFPRKMFWEIFSKEIPKTISRMSKQVKISLSVNALNDVLACECDKFIKPNSTTQVRIFGLITVQLYEFNPPKQSTFTSNRYST